jgi:hypothetical protein
MGQKGPRCSRHRRTPRSVGAKRSAKQGFERADASSAAAKSPFSANFLPGLSDLKRFQLKESVLKVWVPAGPAPQQASSRMSELAKSVDRQKHPRHATLCPAKLVSGDEEVDCEVLNVSVGGAKIRMCQPVETNSHVRVKLGRLGEFAGRVAWRNGTTLGVEFQDEIAEMARIVEDILSAEADSGERREDARASVLWSGKLRSAGQLANCRIVNFSLKGVQLLAEKEIDCGLEVILWIERFGEFTTKLIWQDGESIGVQFVDPPKTIEARFGDSLPILR